MRMLPGTLVILRMGADATLIRPPGAAKTQQDGLMFTSDQKSRLAERLHDMMAANMCSVYLVITASASKTLLMRCDTLQYLIAPVGDVIDVSEKNA